MDRFDILVGVICKMSHNLSSTLLGLENVCISRYVSDVLGWLDLASRVLSRFGSLLVSVAGCHHDVTRCPSYLFVTTSGIGI